MTEKLLIILLTVMLCVFLFCNAFGIAYQEHDFISIALQGENWILNTSPIVQKIWSSIKELVASGFDLLDIIYDATLGRFAIWLEERFGFSFGDLLYSTLKFFEDNMKMTKIVFEFFVQRNPSVHNFLDEFLCFVNALFTSSFYTDFENKDGFDWQMCNEYIDFIVYDKDNRFSYVKHEAVTNALNNRDGKIVNTVLVSSGIYNSDITIDDSDYWFTTENLQMPDDWLPTLPALQRTMYYFVGLHRVKNSNIYFEEDGVVHWLSGFKIRTTSDGTLFPATSVCLGGVNYIVDFMFSYDVNEETVQSYWMSAEEFRSRFKSSWLLSIDTFHLYVKNEVLTRDDVYTPE